MPTTFLVKVGLRVREGTGDLRLLKLMLLLLLVLLPPPPDSLFGMLLFDASKGGCWSVGVVEEVASARAAAAAVAAASSIPYEGDPALVRRLFGARTCPPLVVRTSACDAMAWRSEPEVLTDPGADGGVYASRFVAELLAEFGPELFPVFISSAERRMDRRLLL